MKSNGHRAGSADAEIADRLRRLDVNSLTPLEALAILDQLKQLVKD